MGFARVDRFQKTISVRLGGEQRLDTTAEVGIVAARSIKVLRSLVWVRLVDGGQKHFFDS